jgi:thymidylate synthase (FAD)
MGEVSVKLLSCLPLWQAAYAARLCADSLGGFDSDDYRRLSSANIGKKDKELLQTRILVEDKMNPPHESVIEHVVYTFLIEDVSRALLQELMRHRIASPSVQSTRWSLKKLLRKFRDDDTVDPVRLDSMIVLTGDDDVDNLSRRALAGIIDLLRSRKVPNDRIKYPLPDAFKTRVMLTINARSLRNLFVLRTSSRALWEIRRMAFAMIDALPAGHMFLFEDRIHDRPKRFRTWM